MAPSTERNENGAGLQHRRAVIGNPSNFWIHSTKSGFDLTHPSSPNDKTAGKRLIIRTSTSPITVSPAKTALVIIDMQNFFLSEVFGRARGAGHAACDKLVKYAIPAARKAGIRIIWLNWGLTEQEVAEMPPAIKRAFGFQAYPEEEEGSAAEETRAEFEESNGSLGVDKDGNIEHQGGHILLENGKDGRIYKGLGSQCGTVTLPSGATIDAGRLLMRDAWNSALYPPLDAIFEEGAKNGNPADVWIHKNRMSGMWGAKTDCEEFLEEHGIRTLLFSGVNTDQCVSGTYTDSFSKGYDCVLLSDGCGTTSPGFSQQCIEFNAAKTWGFCCTCEDLALGVEQMNK